MRDYTAEELKQIQVDIDRTSLLWSRFKEQYKDGADVSLHPPPVLIQAGKSLVEEVLGLDERNTDFQLFRGIVNIGVTLFEFGQFCHANGHYVSSMAQCICCKVHDDDIARLIADA